MTQALVAAPVPMRLQPETPESELLDPLWRLAGNMQAAQVLVVATHGLELICGLIRRGCPAATIMRPGDKPDADDYDVVVVPCVTELMSSDDVIRIARHSLAPNGQLIAGVTNAEAAAALARRLRLNGFSALHSLHLPDRLLLRAELRRPS